MPLNQGCSNFEFRDNQITVIEGSQHNTIYNNRTFQTVRQERKELTIWDQYERVRTGDVNLVEAVGTSNEYDWDRPSRWSRVVVVCRTIGVARIRGEDKESGFLYVGYSGPKAIQAFKQDFDYFSAAKRLNVAQLFGYNDGQYGLPALIFYDALIPLNCVLLETRANYHPVLPLYFRLQLTATEMEGLRYVDPDILWIEPRSGALRRGPYVPSNATWLTQLSSAPTTSHLSVQAYSDTNAVMDYLVRILPLGTIFNQLQDQYKTHRVWSNASKLWPYLVGSLWTRNRRHIIARWTGLRDVPRYVCVDCDDYLPKCKEVMKDGSMRFRYTDPTDFNLFWVSYKLFHGSEELDTESPWLAQAHSIFSQLGIHEDEWTQYAIIDYFQVMFYPIKVHTDREEDTNTAPNKPTPYLFVRPIPRLSDDETTWRSWGENTYFWSLDHSGQEEMSESIIVSLGLPAFYTDIMILSASWSFEAYKLMERFQYFKGFDPKTADYARSLGYPVIQVVGEENRFQELGELNDDRSMSVVHHDDVSSATPNDTPANEVPDTEIDDVTVGKKWGSKVAGSSSKRRKVHTDSDHGEGEGAMAESRIKRRRTSAAAYAKDTPQVPKRGKWDDLPQRELSSRKARPSVRAQEAREAKSEGSASKKRGRGGPNGQVRADGKAR